mgnify:CR=1 FL=1
MPSSPPPACSAFAAQATGRARFGAREEREIESAAEQAGQRAIPGYFIIPGAPRPPTAAWDSAVSSGVASLYAPDLRLELSYFYTELVGIHDNYVRRLEFTEREILPRAEVGPDAFYDSTGRLRPEFAVEMRLLADFGHDLRHFGTLAGSLRSRLEALQSQD